VAGGRSDDASTGVFPLWNISVEKREERRPRGKKVRAVRNPAAEEKGGYLLQNGRGRDIAL